MPTVVDDADGTTTTKALRTADIYDGQSTYIDLPATAYDGTEPLIIRYRMESEGGYDFFRIYRDGVQQYARSGVMSAAYEEFNVVWPAGNYVVRLYYGKDGSGSYGIDGVDFSSITMPSPIDATGKVVSNLTASPFHNGAFARWEDTGVRDHEYRVDGGVPVAASGSSATITGLTDGTLSTIEVRPVSGSTQGNWTSVSVTPADNGTIYDDFNRADVAPSLTALGSATSGQPWVQPSGAIGIQAGQAYVTGDGENLAVVAGVRDIDITFQINVGGNLTGDGIVFRYRDTNNYWLWEGDYLYHKTVGSLVNVQQVKNYVPRAGDVVRLVCLGDGIKVFINDVLNAVYGDTFSAIDDTGVGMRMYWNGDHVEYFYAKPTDPAEFSANADLAPVLANVAAAARPVLDSFVYKGRDSMIDDDGSVA